jgi:hypothetical protein
MNKEDKKDLPVGWDCVVTTAPFDFAQGASFIVVGASTPLSHQSGH